MNFFVSMLVLSVLVFQAYKWMGPLPEKINAKINYEMSARDRNLQAAMMNDFSTQNAFSSTPVPLMVSTPSTNVDPVATPVRRWADIKHTNKPLVTFERYIAKQKKLKKQKRAVASAVVKKNSKVKKYQAKKPVIKRNQKVASGSTRV